MTQFGEENNAIDDMVRRLCEVLNQSAEVMAERLRSKAAGIVRLIIRTEKLSLQRKVFSLLRGNLLRKQKKNRSIAEVELKYDLNLLKKCF
jgi:hypothetical protein